MALEREGGLDMALSHQNEGNAVGKADVLVREFFKALGSKPMVLTVNIIEA